MVFLLNDFHLESSRNGSAHGVSHGRMGFGPIHDFPQFFRIGVGGGNSYNHLGVEGAGRNRFAFPEHPPVVKFIIHRHFQPGQGNSFPAARMASTWHRRRRGRRACTNPARAQRRRRPPSPACPCTGSGRSGLRSCSATRIRLPRHPWLLFPLATITFVS